MSDNNSDIGVDEVDEPVNVLSEALDQNLVIESSINQVLDKLDDLREFIDVNTIKISNPLIESLKDTIVNTHEFQLFSDNSLESIDGERAASFLEDFELSENQIYTDRLEFFKEYLLLMFATDDENLSKGKYCNFYNNIIYSLSKRLMKNKQIQNFIYQDMIGENENINYDKSIKPYYKKYYKNTYRKFQHCTNQIMFWVLGTFYKNPHSCLSNAYSDNDKDQLLIEIITALSEKNPASMKNFYNQISLRKYTDIGRGYLSTDEEDSWYYNIERMSKDKRVRERPLTITFTNIINYKNERPTTTSNTSGSSKKRKAPDDKENNVPLQSKPKLTIECSL